jgi:hypothetical protein
VTQPYQPQFQPQPYPPQPPYPPPPQLPQKQRGWARFGVLMGILWLAGCGAIINAVGSDDDPATTAQPTPAAAQATNAPPVDEKPEPEPEPEPTQETVKVGEKVRDDDYQFTVTRVKCGVSRVGDEYFGDKAQGQFCLVSMKIKNVGDEPINYSEENQALIDTRRREYSSDDEAWIHLDGSAPWGEINPGNTQKAVIAFDIPKKAKPDHLLLKAGVWGASDGVVVKLA